MSLIKTFVDAFKKASAPKDKSALEQVRDQAGLGVSADTDAFEPIPQPGGTPGGTANFIPNPQVPRDTEPIRRPPSKPTPPAEPGETGTFEGGDGGNTPTYPSAPFDPVTVKFPNTQAQGGGLPDAPDGGDKIAGPRRPPTGIKAEGVEPPLGSSDPEEGGEVSEAGKTDLDEGFIRRLRLVDDGSTVVEGGDTPESTEYSGETTRQGTPLVQVGSGGDGSEGSGPHPPGPGTGGSEGEPELISFVDRRGGATQPSNPFKVEMEEVLVSPAAAPAAPGGVPIPYPLAEGARSDGGAGALISGKMKVPHKIEGAIAPGASEATVSDGEGSGVSDSLARKAGEGQKDFLKVEMKEAVITRDAPTGIDGESSDKDHKGEIEVLARRTEVTDAHDRLSTTGPGAPAKAAAPLMEDDDDLESNTLLDLKPEPAVKGMLPGLAGQVSEGLDLDVDLDADDGPDESEL